MTATSNLDPVVLEPEYAETIRATLPLVAENIDRITSTFYSKMFAAHPELKNDLFNRGNQAVGAQQRALAASIATFATHLVDDTTADPIGMLRRIGHKHVSLGVTADQYQIVHDNLFAAIVEVLGAETVTEPVAAAWDRVYWLMAEVLIDLEKDLYADAGVSAGDVFDKGTVVGRVDDASGAVVLTIDAPRFTSSVAGQYVSVGVTLPDGARQLRQYTLVNAEDDKHLQIAIRPVVGVGDSPDGEVSTWLRENAQVGTVLDVTHPFGDFPVPPADGAPLALISAGIGITPMVALLKHEVAAGSDRPIIAIQADTTAQTHPLRQVQQELVSELGRASLYTWYAEEKGPLDLTDIDIPLNAHVYLCGSPNFLRSVRNQLSKKGIADSQVYFELFHPDDWLLS